MKTVDIITLVLIIVGGLNWGLVGAFNFNLVEALLGHFPVIVRIVYVLVGLSAIYQIFRLISNEQRLLR